MNIREHWFKIIALKSQLNMQPLSMIVKLKHVKFSHTKCLMTIKTYTVRYTITDRRKLAARQVTTVTWSPCKLTAKQTHHHGNWPAKHEAQKPLPTLLLRHNCLLNDRVNLVVTSHLINSQIVVYLMTFHYLSNLHHSSSEPWLPRHHSHFPEVWKRFALIANMMFRLPSAGIDTSKIFYFLEMIITLFSINVSRNAFMWDLFPSTSTEQPQFGAFAPCQLQIMNKHAPKFFTEKEADLGN